MIIFVPGKGAALPAASSFYFSNTFGMEAVVLAFVLGLALGTDCPGEKVRKRRHAVSIDRPRDTRSNAAFLQVSFFAFAAGGWIILCVYVNTMVSTRGKRGKTPPPKPALKKTTTKARAPARSSRFVVPSTALKPWGSMAGRSVTPSQLRKHANDLRAARAEHEREVAIIRSELTFLKEQIRAADANKNPNVVRADRGSASPQKPGWISRTIGGVKYLFRSTSPVGHLVGPLLAAGAGAVVTYLLTSGPSTLAKATEALVESGQAAALTHLGTSLTGNSVSGSHMVVPLKAALNSLLAQGYTIS